MKVFDRNNQEVFIPESRNVILYTDDMDKECDCIHCGKTIRYGDGYTSRNYFSPMGFGFPECSDCYFEEGRW